MTSMAGCVQVFCSTPIATDDTHYIALCLCWNRLDQAGSWQSCHWRISFCLAPVSMARPRGGWSDSLRRNLWVLRRSAVQVKRAAQKKERHFRRLASSFCACCLCPGEPSRFSPGGAIAVPHSLAFDGFPMLMRRFGTTALQVLKPGPSARFHHGTKPLAVWLYIKLKMKQKCWMTWSISQDYHFSHNLMIFFCFWRPPSSAGSARNKSILKLWAPKCSCRGREKLKQM